MIKYVDESRCLSYCAAYYSCEMYNLIFLLGKKIRIYIFGKKGMLPMMSTSCYLGPGFSYLRNSVCLMLVA